MFAAPSGQEIEPLDRDHKRMARGRAAAAAEVPFPEGGQTERALAALSAAQISRGRV